MALIYKILRKAEWAAAQAAGELAGSAVDLADGFIHFSTGFQVVETAERHFAGAADLILLTVTTEGLETSLRWEPSRGGDLFPHLYGVLALNQILQVQPLPLPPNGRHKFPAEIGR
jgi:uncharacterized protein (DUF952 family)